MDEDMEHPKHSEQSTGRAGAIPSGFSELEGPTGQVVLVPRFMVPAAMTAFDAIRYADNMNVDQADGGVSSKYFFNFLNVLINTTEATPQ